MKRAKYSVSSRTVAANVTCPICNAAGQIDLEIGSYEIYGCPACSHQFVNIETDESHVEQVYVDTYFTGGGDGYSDYLLEEMLLVERGRFYADLLAGYTNPGQLLDVGAAAGFLLQGFVDRGWQGEGIEPNQRMANYGSQNDLTIFTGSYETFKPNKRYDAITMIQVVGHFYDVQSVFNKVREQLKPGGLLLIETWNKDSWTARILGTRWHEYSPPSVLNYFSKQSLRRLGERFGLDYLDAKNTFKRIMMGHAQSLLEHKLKHSSSWLRLACKPLQWLPQNLSLVYPADDLFWMLFRQSRA